MKMLLLAAATIAAATSPAFAESTPAAAPQGHYEWRPAHQFGPRAPLEAARRIWVPDKVQMANCDCATMKSSSADGMGSPSSTSTAG